jgi:hypothetical protein
MWDYNMRNGQKSVYKATKEWDPATARWEIPWAHEGGDFDSLNPITQSLPDTTVKRWEHFDVTETIKQLVQNPANNFGFLIKFDDNDRRGIMIYSAENEETDKRPKLVINGGVTHIQKVKNNPASDIAIFTQGNGLWVRLPMANRNGKISVYSIEGRQIASVSVNTLKSVFRIAEKLTSGAYFIKFESNNKLVIKKSMLVR